MEGEKDPWSRYPDMTEEEWAIEVARRRAESARILSIMNAEREAARERRNRWKEAVGDMSPRQIGDWLMELRDGGHTLTDITSTWGISSSTITKYSKLSVNYRKCRSRS